MTVAAIGLAEPLIDLGVLADGTAQTPTNYADAGWFSNGGRPGGIGPTVLLGHVDSLDGPAVFYRLSELSAGDEVRIGLSDGTTATYFVTTTSVHEKDDFPTFAVFGVTPEDVLHLVTCGGAFDEGALSYESNIVVTVERVHG